jgi:hypothetical protein
MLISDPWQLLRAEPVRHWHTRRKLVFISGLSDPTTCALSEQQRRFLASLAMEESAKVYANFPFFPCADRPYRMPPLWLASWRNFQAFRRACSEKYLRLASPHWQALRASSDELLVVTLSCGLEIVNRLHERNPGPPLEVVALGPVAWRRPTGTHTLVQGSWDWISARFFAAPDVTISGLGHMSYLADCRVMALIQERLGIPATEDLPSRWECIPKRGQDP